VIVDRNTLQLADRTETIMPLEPLADKWGLSALTCEVQGPKPVRPDLDVRGGSTAGASPTVAIRTVKGKGFYRRPGCLAPPSPRRRSQVNRAIRGASSDG
jgi:hypothetical protein